ncbi:MAG: DUF1640 domain-containing protein [Alphaproteobacteria bacterium]
MTTVTFDTLKYVDKLRAAGVPEAQAKVQAEVLVFALDEVMDQQLATKADIARLERELKADSARLEREVKTEFKEVRSDIDRLVLDKIVPMQRDLYVIKWMMGMVLAGIMAIILKTYFPA